MPKWPFFKKPRRDFEVHLRSKLHDLDADFALPIWTLIYWLESKGQCFRYTSDQEPFLSTTLVKDKDALWSHVNFVLPPDMVRFWFGKQGYEKQVIPFLRCGSDGSYIALWRRPDTEDSFVFLGSEGDAFVVAEDPKQLIALATMGYTSIEGRDVLAASPKQVWRETHSGSWPEPIELMAWTTENLGVLYPENGVEILPYALADDPFAKFATKETSY